jgi:hypothetical protein
MRRALLILLLPCLLVGCLGTQPYYSIDVQQVNRAYVTLKPIFLAFRSAYLRRDAAGMAREYAREQRACRLVDTIDHRDTIDSSTNLYVASSYLDSFCNDIETAYSLWRKAHGQSYDKSLPPTLPGTYFLDGDYNLTEFPILMRHPAGLWKPVTPIATPPTLVPTP